MKLAGSIRLVLIVFVVKNNIICVSLTPTSLSLLFADKMNCKGFLFAIKVIP